MKKNNNFRDIYFTNYYSFFPIQKSNKQVLKYSQVKKLKDNKAIIDIPPSVTFSYMKKILYIQTSKKYRILKGRKRPKTSNNQQSKKIRYKSCSNFYSKKKNIINNCILFDNKKLEQIFKESDNKVISDRKKLNPGKDQIPSYITKSMNPRPDITTNEALKILNKINFPSPPKNTDVPDYINGFKIRNFIEREYERLVEE